MTAGNQALVPVEPRQNYESTSGGDAVNRALQMGLRLIARGLSCFARGATKLADSARATAHQDVRSQLVELPFFGLTQVLPGNRGEREIADYVAGELPAARPVVLLHGLGGSAGNWTLFRQLLKLRGRTNIYRFDYRDRSSMAEIVPECEAYLRALIAKLPDGVNIDIIGHSLGGVVARAALRNDDIRARVNHVITIGTPHHGTHLARLGGFGLSMEISPGSSFLTMLNAEENRAIEREEVRITTFSSTKDVIVLPTESAQLDGAHNVAMNEASHVSWLIRPRLAYRILEVLDEPAAATDESPAA